MEIDTGASLSTISQKTYRSLNNASQLQSTEARQCTYTGEPLPVQGSITVSVHHNHQQKTLPLLVVGGRRTKSPWQRLVGPSAVRLGCYPQGACDSYKAQAPCG